VAKQCEPFESGDRLLIGQSILVPQLAQPIENGRLADPFLIENDSRARHLVSQYCDQ
jgi:hypothetical protein